MGCCGVSAQRCDGVRRAADGIAAKAAQIVAEPRQTNQSRQIARGNRCTASLRRGCLRRAITLSLLNSDPLGRPVLNPRSTQQCATDARGLQRGPRSEDVPHGNGLIGR